MASDMFLELDGIQGESVDATHKDKINILAFSWGVSNSGSHHIGVGGGTGKASFTDLSITKYVDKATPKLLQACASGQHIAKGKVIVRKSGGKPYEYLVYTLEKIVVSGVSTGGSMGEERLTENVSLNFAKVAVEYHTQDPTKGTVTKAGTFAWDIARNAA